MSYADWSWQQLVKELDKAGYAIVKKPILTDKGIQDRDLLNAQRRALHPQPEEGGSE